MNAVSNSEEQCSTNFSFLLLREAEKECQFSRCPSDKYPEIGTEHQTTYYICPHSAFIIRYWLIYERQRHFSYLADNPFWPTPPQKKCVHWFRVTQLRAVPFKAIKCGFFFSEVILFNPSGLKQAIKQSL